MLRIDRRAFIAGFAALPLLLTPFAALAQGSVNVQDLHAPGQLGDKALGLADAPVTVVEYASMSCPHCAHFDGTTFDRLDLSSANAIVGTATAALRTALEDAIGDTGPGRALLSLAGLLAPRGDPGSPHVIDAGDLAAGPTRAPGSSAACCWWWSTAAGA